MPTQFGSEDKKVIRSRWAKPLLAFLHNILGKKLFYLGLPDSQAFDIHEWIEYLDVVYAFQCRDHKAASDPSQSRDKILELESVGLSLNRRGKLSDFQVFDGYIEEVVLRGYDNSPTRKDFIQNDVVTVYNLDFCNNISSPIKYLDRQGNYCEAYKFNAIKKLMEIQASLPFSSQKFVLFLTVHCSYDGQEFTNFHDNPPDDNIKSYLEATKGFSLSQKSPYWVKAFVYHSLKVFFTNANFVPEFLPVIHYLGDNEQPLLFFTILGTQVTSGPGVTLANQKPVDFLFGKFISVNSANSFINNEDLVAHSEKNWPNLSCLHLFKSSTTYKKIWKDIK